MNQRQSQSVKQAVQPKGTVGRRERFPDSRHDPYRDKKKLQDASVCPNCGAVVDRGRWAWGSVEVVTAEVLCPACRRIADRCEAGRLEIRGALVESRRTELDRLIRNVGADAQASRPLERIMSVDYDGAICIVLTTDIHLPRRLADAIQSAFGGEVSVAYGENAYQVRATVTIGKSG